VKGSGLGYIKKQVCCSVEQSWHGGSHHALVRDGKSAYIVRRLYNFACFLRLGRNPFLKHICSKAKLFLLTSSNLKVIVIKNKSLTYIENHFEEGCQKVSLCMYSGID